MKVETPEVVEASNETNRLLRVANVIALATNLNENITDIQARGRVLRQLGLVEGAVRDNGGQ